MVTEISCNLSKSQTELFTWVFHFTCTKISAHKYKISWALLPDVSILSFLRNCYNTQVTVSFVSANNLQTLLPVHSSMYTHLVNRYFLSVKLVNQLQRDLAHTMAYSKWYCARQRVSVLVVASLIYQLSWKKGKRFLTQPGGLKTSKKK